MCSEKFGNLVNLVCREIVSDDVSLGAPQVGRRIYLQTDNIGGLLPKPGPFLAI